MKTTNRALLAVAVTFASICFDNAAAASTTDETSLLTALQKAHPGTHITNVARTPIPDLYEVWMGSNMALVSKRNLRYLVFGRVFDTKTMTDLTAPKLAQVQRQRIETENSDDDLDNTLQAIPIEQLPLADAIKTVRGNASRLLVVFSDPACPYCKRLEPELDKLDNVTIYTFLVPFQGYALPTAIWCAADRQKAWHQAMAQGDQNSAATSSPQASTPCAHPLEHNLALAKQLKVHGTPTIFYADGHRTDGYVDAAEIEARLVRASSHTPNATTHQQEKLP